MLRFTNAQRLVSALALAAFPVHCATAGQTNRAEIAAWVRSTAIPLTEDPASNDFTDLRPLAAKLGEARIVALGEPTHGTREAFQTKARLIEYLVAELGFSVFAMETEQAEQRRY